jgi:hypothetical protein
MQSARPSTRTNRAERNESQCRDYFSTADGTGGPSGVAIAAEASDPELEASASESSRGSIAASDAGAKRSPFRCPAPSKC